MFSKFKKKNPDKDKTPAAEPPKSPGHLSQISTSSLLVVQTRPAPSSVASYLEVEPRRGIGKEDTSNTREVGVFGVQNERSRLRAVITGSFLGRERSPSAIVKLDRTKDPLGLTILYEPEIRPSLDIIFVHGLGGSSRATWCHNHDPEFFWPHKWLPQEPGIQDARISSFGYDSNFRVAGSSPISNIADFAKSLLFSLKFAKNKNLGEANIGERPIIFIAHSMGGLVAKKAFLLGRNDPEYSGIISKVSSILFLATPHRGSNLAELLNMILQVEEGEVVEERVG